MYKQLFIGLGGQGAKSICELKKVFHQRKLNSAANPNVKEIDVPYEFLSIDSSGDVWSTKESWKFMGEDLSLDESEKCLLTSSSISRTSGNIVPWLYSKDDNVAREQQAIFNNQQNFTTPGAQQKRRYGRALFAANADLVYTRIIDAYKRLTGGKDSENSCVINVFCSLGGGTGSGGIVDLITMLRMMFPAKDMVGQLKAYPINLYLFLTDARGIDPQIVQDGKFFANEYAALKDLNALCTGLFCPHVMKEISGVVDSVTNESAKIGKRINLGCDTAIDAIIISTNNTSKNDSISIEKQIKRAAEWAVDRITFNEGATDSNIEKIATGEDFKSDHYGEPKESSNGVFVERAYRFANLGGGKWEYPVNEFCLMAVHSILANSYRQLVYNTPTENEGYLSSAPALEEIRKANYFQMQPEDFLLYEYVKKGWEDWVVGQQEIEALKNGVQDSNALRKIEQMFETFYNDKVKETSSIAAGEVLSLPGRKSKMLASLKEKFKLENSMETSVSDLLYTNLMNSLVKDWKEGMIGLIQAKEIVEYVRDSAKRYADKLSSMYDDKGERDMLIFDVELKNRTDSTVGEWYKLTKLSYKFKGKKFIDEHIKDLVEVYTMKTQRAHLREFEVQMRNFAEMLDSFCNSLEIPITYLNNEIEKEENLYKKTPLYGFIFGNVQLKESQKLEYDYNSEDDRLRRVINYINTQNSDGRPNTIATNAEKLRGIVAGSISGGPTLAHLFGGNGQMKSDTEKGLLKNAYKLAGEMLRDADKFCNTKILGGLVEHIKSMDMEKIKEKFSSLMRSATFSYYKQKGAQGETNMYYENPPTKKAWVVSFPRKLQFPEMGEFEGNRAAYHRFVINTLGASASGVDVYVSASDDNSKISVWQTEYACPARYVDLVPTIRTFYQEKMKSFSVEERFWSNIDDLMSEMAAPLTCPIGEELDIVCEAAMWFVEQCPEAFERRDGRIFKNGSSENGFLFDTKILVQSDRDLLLFISNLQNHLYTIIRNNRELLKQLKNKYEAELRVDDYDLCERRRAMVNSFIKPTLFRIAMALNMRDVYNI